MLVLTFRVDQIVYAVPVSQVIEVVPRVALRQVPHAPGCFLGLLHYRGGAVPVVDLGLLMGSVAVRGSARHADPPGPDSLEDQTTGSGSWPSRSTS